MSENMLDFQCPHCRVNHQLPMEFAGNRQACSACGETMRLPSIVRNPANGQKNAKVNQSQTGAIMVSCPLCSKTLYASQQQAGKEVLCETCLESIPVPGLAPDQRQLKSDTPERSLATTTQNEAPSPKAAPAVTSKPESVLKDNNLNPTHEHKSLEAEELQPNEFSAAESGEFKLEPLANKPPGSSSPSATEIPPESAATTVSLTPIESVAPANEQPSNQEEEIIELEAIGEAPSIPVHPLQPATAVPVDITPEEGVEYELVVRWAVLCPCCQARLIVYQQDVGNTVQCSNCNQPVTVESRQPVPRPERVAKILHHYIGQQTRIAVLSKNQPQPEREIVYKTIIEWEVQCDVCGTGLAATPEDVGTQKKCPDCYKVHTIVAPSKMPEPIKRIVRDELEELNSPQVTTAQSNTPSKQILSEMPDMRAKIQRDEYVASRQILEKAQQQQNKKNELQEELHKNKNEWLNAITQLVTIPNTVARITLLTIGYAVTAAFFSMSLNLIADNSSTQTESGKDGTTAVSEQIDIKQSIKAPASVISNVGAILLFIATLTLFIVVNLAGLPTLMNILRQTAEGDLELSYWPPFSITSWFSDAAIMFIGICYSLIPASIVFTVLNLMFQQSLIPMMLSSITAIILFPFVLMNILGSGSLARPLSGEFTRQLKYQSDLLAKFLFFTILVIIITLVGFNLLISRSLMPSMVGGSMIWIGYVLLARLVGFLGFNLTVRNN